MKLLISVIALASLASRGSAQKKQSTLLKCDCSTIMSFTNDLRSSINTTLSDIMNNPQTHPDVKLSLDEISVSLHVQKTETLLPAVVDTVSSLLTRTSEDNLGVTINTFDVLTQLLPSVTATETQGDSVLQIITLLLRVIVNLFITRLDTSVVNLSIVNGVVLSAGNPVGGSVIMDLLRGSQLSQLNSLSGVLLGNVFNLGTPLLPPVNNVLSLLDGAAGGGLTSTTGGLLMALTSLVGNLQALTDSNTRLDWQPSYQIESRSAISIDITSTQTITQSDEFSRQRVATYRINLTALPGILSRLVDTLTSSTQSDRTIEIITTITNIQDILQRFTQDQGDTLSGTLLARSILDLIDVLNQSNDETLSGFIDELWSAMVVVNEDQSQLLTTTASPMNSAPVVGKAASIVLTLTKTQNNNSDVTQIKKEIDVADLDRVLTSILSSLNPNATAPLAHRRIRINIQALQDMVKKIAAEDYTQKDVLSFVNLLISIYNQVTAQKDPRFARPLLELKTMLPVFPSDEPSSEIPSTTSATTLALLTTLSPTTTAVPKVTLSPISLVDNSSRTVVVGSNRCRVPMTTVINKLGEHLVDDLRSLTELLSSIDENVPPKAGKLIYQLIYLLERATSRRITDTALLNHVVDILVVTMKLKKNAGTNTNILSIVDLLLTKLRSILAIFTSSSDGIIGSISLTTTVIQVLFNNNRLSVESAVQLLRQMCFTGRVGNSWNIIYVLIQLLEKLAPRMGDINPNIVALVQKVIKQLKDLSPTSTVSRASVLADLTSTLQELVGSISNSGLTSTEQNSLNGIVKLVLSILLRMVRTNTSAKLQNLMTGIQVNKSADCDGVLAAVGCLLYDILSKNGGKFGRIVVQVANNNAAPTSAPAALAITTAAS